MSHPLVVHRRERHDVYIGRPSKWGNPFTHEPRIKTKHPELILVETREEAVNYHAEWILHQPELMQALHELKGKKLGCFCAPLACHGDTLAALANPEDA